MSPFEIFFAFPQRYFLMLFLIEDIQMAFKDFYDQTHGKAYRFALKHTASAAVAEEIIQTAYLKLWEKRSEIQPNFPAFKSYLYTTVRNLAIKEYQRLLQEQELIQQFHQIESNIVSEDRFVDMLSEVNKEIEALPSKQQQVFRLVKMEGFTYAEVAKKLNISESTVEKHIIKALRTLRTKLSNFVFSILL